MTRKAVLVVCFNRPDLALKVVSAVARYRPSAVYLACDGPRIQRPSDQLKVAEVRNLLLATDWKCPVYTKFQPTNLGLRTSMVTALDWFFSNESEGVVLEDDCVPTADFFRFMEFILDYYRDEPSVWGATGSNPSNSAAGDPRAFSFVSTALIWGWCSWADRWQAYDRDLKHYCASGFRRNMERWPDPYTFHALDWHLNRLATDESPGSWAYQWAWTVAKEGGLWGVPHANLIQNLGFRNDATHTKTKRLVSQEVGALGSIHGKPSPVLNRTLQRRIQMSQHRVLSPLVLNRVRDVYRDAKLLATKLSARVSRRRG